MPTLRSVCHFHKAHISILGERRRRANRCETWGAADVQNSVNGNLELEIGKLRMTFTESGLPQVSNWGKFSDMSVKCEYTAIFY